MGTMPKMDALDYVMYYAYGKLDKAKEASPIDPIVYEVVKEALQETRGLGFRTCYIRDDKVKVRMVFVMWEQLKKGDMNMKEIYENINLKTDIPTSTIEKYINKFRRGQNPMQPCFDFGEN